jgi:hypothetical protein
MPYGKRDHPASATSTRLQESPTSQSGWTSGSWSISPKPPWNASPKVAKNLYVLLSQAGSDRRGAAQSSSGRVLHDIQNTEEGSKGEEPCDICVRFVEHTGGSEGGMTITVQWRKENLPAFVLDSTKVSANRAQKAENIVEIEPETELAPRGRAVLGSVNSPSPSASLSSKRAPLPKEETSPQPPAPPFGSSHRPQHRLNTQERLPVTRSSEVQSASQQGAPLHETNVVRRERWRDGGTPEETYRRRSRVPPSPSSLASGDKDSGSLAHILRQQKQRVEVSHRRPFSSSPPLPPPW